MNRRTLLMGAAAAGAVAVAGAGAVWTNRNAQTWQDATAALRRPFPPDVGGAAAQEALIRSATLAASSHNTQAWRFAPDGGGITLLPDVSRRTPVVDPDDHHLFVSLGAAAENMVQAAPALGLVATPQFDLTGAGGIRVALRPGKVLVTDLGQAIPHRQCTRGLYDGRPVPAAALAALTAAGSGGGVSLLVITQRPAMAAVAAFIRHATARQLADPAFRTELKSWMRFSYTTALATDDGLFAPVSGTPALPEPLGRALFDWVLSATAEAAKSQAQIDSSAGLAIFASDRDDPAHWVAAGRAYQRFALTATALGLKHAFLNQAVEVAAVRRDLAAHLGLGARRPDLIVRFGYGESMPWSLRRPVADVLA